MKKQIIFIFSLAFSLCFAGEYTTDAKALGGHFGSNFQSAIVAPGTGASDFRTIDGQSTFNANMTCEGAVKSVAEISYSGTSDITATIKLDINGDGIKEITNSISGVSGICAEGVIKCSSNSWNNCQYYSYQYSATGINTQLSSQANLSNCYCINSSCGSQAVTNKTSVLDDITASVYGTLQSNMSRLVLTRTTNDGVTAQIFGENQDTCTNYQTGSQSFNQNTITSDGQTLLATTQSNADSPANSLLNATVNENSFDYSTDKEALKTKASSIAPATQANKIISANGETFDLSNSEDIDEIKYCQVQKLKANAQVYVDASTAHTSNTTNTEIAEYELRECTGTDGTNCPYETGETIKYQCGEVNKSSFAESVGQINSMQNMANDMSCSTN